MKSSLLFIFFMFSFSLNATASELDQAAIDIEQKIKKLASYSIMKRIESISEQIASACLPPDCIIIGVGRSPTPFMTYIEIAGIGKTINLPLSNFRYRLNPINKKEASNLNKTIEEKTFRYFDNFLYEKIQNSNANRIMLVDFGVSGKSLFSAEEFINKYFNLKKIDISVSSFLIYNKNSKDAIIGMSKKKNISTPFLLELDDDEPLAKNLFFQDYDNVSKYASYEPSLNQGLPITNNSDLRKAYVQAVKNYYNQKSIQLRPCSPTLEKNKEE